MGSYEPPTDQDDCSRVKRDCDEVKVISRNPRDFLLDGKPQYYEDVDKKGE